MKNSASAPKYAASASPVFEERIDQRGRRIGNQQHVAFVDRRPAADRRAVDAEAGFEGILGQLADRVRHVLLQAGEIGEAQVELLNLMLARILEDFFRSVGRCQEFLLNSYHTLKAPIQASY